MMLRYGIVVGGMLAYLGCLHAVQGQVSGGGGGTSDARVDSAQWATITTDTGDLAPGHQTFSRYTDLRLCLIAANAEVARGRNTLAARELEDSIWRATPEYDTRSPRVTAVASACSARFPLHTLTDDMAQAHVQLALLAHDDSIVTAMVRRQIMQPLYMAERERDQMRDQKQRQWLQDHLITIEQLYLDAHPARVAAARGLVAALDADPASDVSTRVRAHSQLMEFWYERDRFMECRVEIAALHTLGLQDGIAAARIDDLYDLRTAMREDAAIAFFTDSDSMEHVVRRWRDVFLRPAVLHAVSRLRTDTIMKDFVGALQNESLASVAATVSPYSEAIARSTEQLESVRADFWFPDTAIRTTVPTPGIVSLVVPLYQCNPSNYMEVLTLRGEDAYDCAGAIILLRRWQRRLGGAGLHVTIVTATNGANVLLGGPKGGAAEAEDLRWYFQDYWHLPVTVAVQATPFRQDSLPVPFWSVDTTNARWMSYQPSRSQLAADFKQSDGVWWLVGPDGKNVWSLYNKFLETTMFDIATVLLARQHDVHTP